MKVVICWPYISGYMSACWRAVAARGDVEQFILGFKSDVPGLDWKFEDDLVKGLDIRLLSEAEFQDRELVRRLVVTQRPDVVVISGWSYSAYCSLVEAPELVRRTKFIMTMDTPYRGSLRQRLGRFKIRHYLNRIDRVLVAGERSRRLAEVLGFREDQIHRGVYGYDADLFDGLHRARLALPGGWPKRFLFVGRYVPPKAIDVLLEAYSQYRRTHDDAWGLTCSGSGPLAEAIRCAPGVVDRGFVQPTELPQVMLEHGILVLPSRYEPWGVVVAEAMGAGLPVICTEAVGASVDLVRHLHNGLLVATDDAASLASAMAWCHRNYEKLPDMGARGCDFAAAFSAQSWADRWLAMLQSVIGKSSARSNE